MVRPTITDDKTLKIQWDVDCSYEKEKKEELSPLESSSSSSSSSSESIQSLDETKPVHDEDNASKQKVSDNSESKPFYLKDLKETYSVYQVK